MWHYSTCAIRRQMFNCTRTNKQTNLENNRRNANQSEGTENQNTKIPPAKGRLKNTVWAFFQFLNYCLHKLCFAFYSVCWAIKEMPQTEMAPVVCLNGKLES